VKTFTARQITVSTSWSMSIVGQQQYAEFVLERGLAVDELFTHRWKLADARHRVPAVRPAVGG
jgi:hypothetical protein